MEVIKLPFFLHEWLQGWEMIAGEIVGLLHAYQISPKFPIHKVCNPHTHQTFKNRGLGTSHSNENQQVISGCVCSDR